ncbi:MAG: maleylacetate reductase [Rhizobiales bacterium]|nr:maleylacetate reductase [Hyphomicrobiales bacterium]
MDSFVYQSQPQRIIFGTGTLAATGEELSRLGCRRALVLSTPQQAAGAEALAGDLGERCAGTFAKAAMHTPVGVTEEALAVVRAKNADAVVSLGGGSTTGLGKAIALRTDLPQIVIPTTYAGSEATPILGETAAGRKTTQRTPKVLPEVVLYDVELTLTLPVALSVTSGLNAIAHAVEARYARERNPLISLLALEAVRALSFGLERIVTAPRDRLARSDALYGAWAAGTCLGSVGMALHHKICHVLGGTFDLPHAETHAVILPHAAAYNDAAAAEQLAPLAAMLGASTAGVGLYDLSRKLGAPQTLAGIGMKRGDLDRAADEIVASPYWNPRPVERGAIRELLEDAFVGKRPEPE